MTEGKSCCSPKQSSCGCGGAPKVLVENAPSAVPPYVEGFIKTAVGLVPSVRTAWDAADRRGAVLARWSAFRNSYRVSPGLYAVGQPAPDSPILVTANYKLTFDRLRRELTGINAWILVLNTHGINVWCAAGKGTFGTEELIRRIRAVELDKVTTSRRLILPQLGAPGVAAHTATRETGFKIIYGPVSAAGLPRFLENGFQKTEAMRTSSFNFRDRLALLPMEFIPGFKLGLLLLIPWIFLEVMRGGHILGNTLPVLAVWFASVAAGSVITPLFLPWIPGAAFSWKGWLMGISAVFAVSATLLGFSPGMIPLLLAFPPLSAYLALNFTGSTTFTSLSGVVREMRIGLPLLAVSLAAGLILKVYWLF